MRTTTAYSIEALEQYSLLYRYGSDVRQAGTSDSPTHWCPRYFPANVSVPLVILEVGEQYLGILSAGCNTDQILKQDSQGQIGPTADGPQVGRSLAAGSVGDVMEFIYEPAYASSGADPATAPESYYFDSSTPLGTVPTQVANPTQDDVVVLTKTGGPDKGAIQTFKWETGAWNPVQTVPAPPEAAQVQVYDLVEQLSTDPLIDTLNEGQLLLLIQNADPTYADVTILNDGDTIKVYETDTFITRWYIVSGGVAVQVSATTVIEQREPEPLTVTTHGLGAAGPITTGPVPISVHIASGNKVVSTTNDQALEKLEYFAVEIIDANTLGVIPVAWTTSWGEHVFPAATFSTASPVYWLQDNGTIDNILPASGHHIRCFRANTTTSLDFHWEVTVTGDLSVVGDPNPDFVWTQGSAAAVWTIVHNRGKRPETITVEVGGQIVEAHIDNVDDNTTTVTFAEAVTGKATLEFVGA